MSRFSTKNIALSVVLSLLFILPFNAHAQNSSGEFSWLTKIFNWNMPVVSHLTNLFEARKDTVESNSLERNQLLNWKRGIVSIASSSPVLISASVFEQKRSLIVAELMTAENGLRSSRSKLADFIDNSQLGGDATSSVGDILVEADADISDVDSAIATFRDYEPVTASSSDLIDLSLPQTYLNNAIMAIQRARASLKSAIAETGDSL